MFDPDAYWQRHGPTDKPDHRQQEAALRKVLAGLPFGSVLEVGCGNGRITRMVPPATVIDISPDRVKATTQRFPDTEGIVSSLQDFDTDRQWDLVIAVEVLMHIPPQQIEQACENLLSLAACYVVTCDWTAPIHKQPAAHNWRHDYQALLRPSRSIPVGKQTIHVMELGECFDPASTAVA